MRVGTAASMLMGRQDVPLCPSFSPAAVLVIIRKKQQIGSVINEGYPTPRHQASFSKKSILTMDMQHPTPNRCITVAGQPLPSHATLLQAELVGILQAAVSARSRMKHEELHIRILTNRKRASDRVT
ncbi:hypothetical protein FOZ62_000763, partial [Perkinsus olseni]